MSGSYYALDAAYNSLQSQIYALSGQVSYVQSVITTPSLLTLNTTFSTLTIASGTSSGVFTQTINIPSAGEYLLNALVRLQYIGTPVSTEGWVVSFLGVANEVKTSNYQSITAPAASLGIIIDTTPTGLVEFDNTLTYPYAVQVQVLINGSPNGVTATGSASAIRIAEQQPAITRVSTTTGAFYPPTPNHLKATGYIIAGGGSAGVTSKPDSGTWSMGGAGGGGGGVSFEMTLPNISSFFYFNNIGGGVNLEYNTIAGAPFISATRGGGGSGSAGGYAGGAGGVGTIVSSPISPSTLAITNGTAGGTGGNPFDTSVPPPPPYPASGTNSLNFSYGFGQQGEKLEGFNTSGFIDVPATPTGSAVCLIVWSIPF